jgi:hypothetical protein
MFSWSSILAIHEAFDCSSKSAIMINEPVCHWVHTVIVCPSVTRIACLAPCVTHGNIARLSVSMINPCRSFPMSEYSMASALAKDLYYAQSVAHTEPTPITYGRTCSHPIAYNSQIALDHMLLPVILVIVYPGHGYSHLVCSSETTITVNEPVRQWARNDVARFACGTSLLL